MIDGMIGCIYANIAGDHRYGSKIEVKIINDCAVVTLQESNPVGGMDGPGGAHPFENKLAISCAPDAPTIVRTIKKVMALENPSVIKRYGKPMKKFNWNGVQERGLSVRLCAEALTYL